LSIESIAPDGAPTRRHRWGSPATVPPAEAFDGNERTERICGVCRLVKITVHPAFGIPWREWRHPDGAATFQGTITPPCIEQVPA
jgi:hypothetical protein